MIMRNKQVSLFLACLGLTMMITCAYALFIGTTKNDAISALVGFNLSAIVAGLSILDYDYLTKNKLK